MGLGPSIKMTTLHHYRCPLVEVATKDNDIEIVGIIVSGVSESYDDKVYSAKRVGDIAKALQVDGALVAIDGWGNHHIDFVNIIESLGKNDISSIGLSFIDLQGRLVCTNQYIDCIIDINKGTTGYESCMVGENNLTDYDAKKAVAILKNKLSKQQRLNNINSNKELRVGKLTKKVFTINEVTFGEKTELIDNKLIIRKNIARTFISFDKRIKQIKVNIIKPHEHNIFVNSNLDCMPIACKYSGELGEGVTHELAGVTVMVTGVKIGTGYQPANIGSSEGVLKDRVYFDRAGTPGTSDYIIHIDFSFFDGEGRTADGVIGAHRLADLIVQEIRGVLVKVDNIPYKKYEYYDVRKPDKAKVVIVKIVSGLGNMYDTVLFPLEPGGILGGRNIRDSRNLPYVISVNQCRDGVIHSLL
ncbi:glycine/sarcosine/betaine reductase component B subunit [Gemella sp. Musashino-2025]